MIIKMIKPITIKIYQNRNVNIEPVGTMHINIKVEQSDGSTEYNKVISVDYVSVTVDKLKMISDLISETIEDIGKDLVN